MCAVSIAALTVYDMCKSVDRGMSISEITLEAKSEEKQELGLRKSMIKLVFFASLREALGCESLELEFEGPLRLSEMIKQVEEKKESIGARFSQASLKIAINKEIVVNDELLSDGCEVAFLPPVTGG